MLFPYSFVEINILELVAPVTVLLAFALSTISYVMQRAHTAQVIHAMIIFSVF